MRVTIIPPFVRGGQGGVFPGTRAPRASFDTVRKKPMPQFVRGKLSCLDAAAKVLSEKKEPMSTAEMIEAMATKGYWKSPGGKTPVPRPAFLAAGALDSPTCL